VERRLVAVMFTDMVGFTALMQEDERLGLERRDGYVGALERHRAAFGGTIVKRLGDGSLSMFPSSLDAVLAAVAIQREPTAQDVAVRIGVHVGEVMVESDDLTGDAVNVASRIESFAVPGGVMLSDSAYDQIRKTGTSSARFRWGGSGLKNVGRLFELYAVSADGIVVPRPDALDGKGERFAGLPSNLPDPVAPLLGRATELAELVALAREHRVVTITGPGGVGKTRMLVELGRQLAPEFLDGVAFVPLADVSDPADFLPALAYALDVKEAHGRTLGEGVVALVGERTALLLLDNLEQVVAAAPEVATLVASCPGLRIVTTSRTPLRIAAEREYPLAPLEVDSAVALFAERARAARGSFELTDENAAVVEAVCRRLDGLPLALELAAARLRLLTPEALLEGLDHVLDVMTSGARDADERHRTLRATVEWSHSLLTAPEQRLFRHLAVFTGDCTLADLEAVWAAARSPTSRRSARNRARAASTSWSRSSTRRSCSWTARATGSGCCRRSASWPASGSRPPARRASSRSGTRTGTPSSPASCATASRAPPSVVPSSGGSPRPPGRARHEPRGRARRRRRGVRGGPADVRRPALLLAHPRQEPHRAGLCGGLPRAGSRRLAHRRAGGALTTAGLAPWLLGEFERSNREWAEAHRVAVDAGAGRELATEAVEQGRALGFTWGEGFARTADGILRTVGGDLDAAETSYSRALEIQQRIGDDEGAGLSASSRRRPGRTCGTRTRCSRAGRSSTRCRRTPTSRASAASGSR
jgi:class 3 adenylate cyclase